METSSSHGERARVLIPFRPVPVPYLGRREWMGHGPLPDPRRSPLALPTPALVRPHTAFNGFLSPNPPPPPEAVSQVVLFDTGLDLGMESECRVPVAPPRTPAPDRMRIASFGGGRDTARHCLPPSRLDVWWPGTAPPEYICRDPATTTGLLTSEVLTNYAESRRDQLGQTGAALSVGTRRLQFANPTSLTASLARVQPLSSS
ncbi:hypothetical protein QBC39DRAFT_114164 [Podospora conica]|nr:hypothetical protein QBC39DRAFT_114164 [Schizothecium conicum]